MFRSNARTLVEQSFALLAAALVAGCSGGGGGGGSTPVPTPTPTQSLSAQIALSADAFVDSIGINTHLGASGSPYVQSAFGTIQNLLVSLGVRHVRDSAYSAGSNASVCSYENGLAAKGIKFTFQTSVTFGAPDILGWAACSGPALEVFESANEYDINHPASQNATWPAVLRTYQQLLYSTVKGNASTASIPVLAPALTTGGAYTDLGNVESYSTYGNIHEGFDGFYPGTPGYGSGGYGSIPYEIAQSAAEAPNEQFYVTEVAYSTADVTNGGDLASQEKYVPRVLFDNFNAGLPRSYYYELIDEPNDGTIPPDLADGLCTVNLAPKPSFTALQSLIALLSDPGSTFTPVALAYRLSGATSDVHETLLQKRSGDYYLAIWREESDFDPNALKDTPVAPENVTLLLAKTPTAASVYAYNSSESLAKTTLTPSTAIPITVTDQVSVIDLSGL
jgi:hypothetical protein